MCVFRERRPTFVWSRTVPAAPATVVPALVAAVEAEARAHPAATLLAVAEGPHVTLQDVPAPALAPAPRFKSTKAKRASEPKRKSSQHITTPVYSLWIISYHPFSLAALGSLFFRGLVAVLHFCTIIFFVCVHGSVSYTFPSPLLSTLLSAHHLSGFSTPFMSSFSLYVLCFIWRKKNLYFFYTYTTVLWHSCVSLCRVQRNRIGLEQRKQFILG